MATILSRLALAGLLTFLVGCDHVTKGVAKVGLEGQPPRDLIHGVLDLQYVENMDTAFNLMHWLPEAIRMPTLIVAGTLALLGIAAALVRFRPKRPLARVAVLLVTAGAVGNYLDRLWRGYVVDFVHLHHWPVFNVADVYVTAGAALLVLSTFKQRPSDLLTEHG
jgi:signal peptidase II